MTRRAPALGDYAGAGGAASRTSYVAYYYNGVGQQVATADYGTNANTPMSGAPTDSADIPVWVDGTGGVPGQWQTRPGGTSAIVSATEYNDCGEVSETIDNAGNETQDFYDDAGNVVQTIQNAQDVGTANSADVVTTTSNYDGQLVSSVAVASGLKTETTQYVYGTATDGATPLIYSNDLVAAVIYSGSSDTVSYSGGNATIDGTDHVSYTYDIQGEVASMTDQNLTTHTYTYDNLGREIADSVTLPTLGGVYNPSNIDTAVMEIGYGYNVQGNLSTVTSYNATSGGTVVNEDYMTYNDAGLPASEYQNPSGSISVNTATAP